jgi:hypothetical protein
MLIKPPGIPIGKMRLFIYYTSAGKQNAESNLTKQSNNAAFCSSNLPRNGLFCKDTYGELHRTVESERG